MMVKTIPLIKRNEKIVDCFLKVKRDYLKFLSKEKIFDQSVATKIAQPEKNLYTHVILDR